MPLHVPKREPINPNASVYTSDSISADHGIVVKGDPDHSGPSSSSINAGAVLTEVRPVVPSDIPGFERDILAESQMRSLGRFSAYTLITFPILKRLQFYILYNA